MRAAIYTRLSLDREGETSTERQEADCRAYAAARGWEVVEVHRDRLSGYKDIRRPGFDAFMEELRTGAVEVGIIWKLDRLTRKGVTGIAPILDALKAGGTSLASVNDNIDTTTPMGKGVLAILASVAEQESHNTSLRTTSAKAAQARAGKPVFNGIRPFGYADDRVTPVPEESARIAEAALAVIAGTPVYDIARQWEADGVRSPVGGVMAPETIRRLLLSPRMAGFREYKGELYPAVWPAILSPETAEALRLTLSARSQAASAAGLGRRRVRSYLLTGGIFCGECGGTLTPRVRGKADGGARRYVCVRVPGRSQNCGRVNVSAEPLEALVERTMLAGMEHLDVVAAPPARKDGLGPLLEESRELQSRLKVLEDAFYVSGALSKGRFEELRDGIVDRLGALDRKIGSLTAESAGSALAGLVDPAKAWSTWSLEQRRQLVQAWWPRLQVFRAARSGSGGTGRTFQTQRLRFVDREGAGWRVAAGELGPELRPEVASDPRFLPL